MVNGQFENSATFSNDWEKEDWASLVSEWFHNCIFEMIKGILLKGPF